LTLWKIQTSASLKARLAPFFSINHPTRGLVLGPFSKLARPVQFSAEHARSSLGLSGRAQPNQQGHILVSPFKSLALDVVSLLLAHGSGGGAGANVRDMTLTSAGGSTSRGGEGDAHAVALADAVVKAIKDVPESVYWTGIMSVRAA
jgi:hypothetical protein